MEVWEERYPENRYTVLWKAKDEENRYSARSIQDAEEYYEYRCLLMEREKSRETGNRSRQAKGGIGCSFLLLVPF
jgi:hypothetical protein